jgi:ABC-type sulfate transport system substrate-binding protein
MSEAAALAPPAEDGSMPAAPLEDTAPSFPAETTPGGTDTATLAVSASAPIDAAQWDAMAEEIRMQVLQRIDLFTDTGLRAQLGARLQPVVDRASADLVATINQHVGEILRAYVAEAIEREIDNWRRDH